MFKHHKDLIIKTQEYDVNTELLKLKFQIKSLKCPEGAGEELSSRISNSVTVCEVEVIKLMNYKFDPLHKHTAGAGKAHLDGPQHD